MEKSLLKDIPSVKKNLISIVREIGSSEEIAKQKVEMISIIATATMGHVYSQSPIFEIDLLKQTTRKFWKS